MHFGDYEIYLWVCMALWGELAVERLNFPLVIHADGKGTVVVVGRL